MYAIITVQRIPTSVNFPMLLKYVCCAKLCLYVKSLKIPRRWCGQSVKNVPLKLTCVHTQVSFLHSVRTCLFNKFLVTFP